MLLFSGVLAITCFVTYRTIKFIRKRKRRTRHRLVHQVRLEQGKLSPWDWDNLLSDLPWSMPVEEAVHQKDRTN